MRICIIIEMTFFGLVVLIRKNFSHTNFFSNYGIQANNNNSIVIEVCQKKKEQTYTGFCVEAQINVIHNEI